MKKKINLQLMVLTLFCMLLAGCGSGQPAPEKITFSDGTKNTLLTYGLHAALAEAGTVNVSSTGEFNVKVPTATAEAPTQAAPFTIQINNLEMKGRWNNEEGTGDFTLSCSMDSSRTDRSDLEDYMGYDEAYFRTTYDYRDTVSATGTITREESNLVLNLAGSIERTGSTNLVRVIVDNGQTTVGDNPTITDKSGSMNEEAVYYFTINKQ